MSHLHWVMYILSFALNITRCFKRSLNTADLDGLSCFRFSLGTHILWRHCRLSLNLIHVIQMNKRIQQFFYRKWYTDCRNEIKCIPLDFCLFDCTSNQLDIHQYHLYNVMVKLTFLWIKIKQIVIDTVFSYIFFLFLKIIFPGDTF